MASGGEEGIFEDLEEMELSDSVEDCLVLVSRDEIVSAVVEVGMADIWGEESGSPVTDTVAP